MSLDAYLNQIGTITREIESGLDRYNNAKHLPVVVASDVRCRKVQRNLRMMDERTGEYAVVRADLVLFTTNAIVQPRDVITINGVAWRITTVMDRQRMNSSHHVSCAVEAIHATQG
jgi:hypothetical protein